MIVDINGTTECDRCGVPLGVTPSIILAMIVSDLGEDGRVVSRHFCRFVVEGAPNGCAGKLMSKTNLAHAREVVEAAVVEEVT